MKSRISPRKSNLTWLGLSVALAFSPGCAFFGTEYVACLDDDSCESVMLGDGDGDIVGAGGVGGTYAAGGTGESTGGDGTGANGSGGNGTGGDGTGGNGSGGDGSGGNGAGGNGTGGNGTGGMGAGGTTQEILDLRRDLHINEIKLAGTGFVELYNSGDASISLSDVRILVAEDSMSGPDYPGACDLAAGTIGAGEVFLAQKGTGGCYGPSDCVQGCGFTLAAGSVVYVQKGTGSLTVESTVDSQEVPSGGGAPGPGESIQAKPDGDDSFSTSTPSAGELNGP